MAMRTTIAACASGIFLFSIAEGLQKRMKARIEGISLIYRLKAGLMLGMTRALIAVLKKAFSLSWGMSSA